PSRQRARRIFPQRLGNARAYPRWSAGFAGRDMQPARSTARDSRVHPRPKPPAWGGVLFSLVRQVADRRQGARAEATEGGLVAVQGRVEEVERQVVDDVVGVPPGQVARLAG